MPNHNQGFTLIEVLLAMAVTVLVGVIAYNSLSVSILAAESNEKAAQRLADIQSTLTLMERDIRHAALRGVVDEFGERKPALEGGASADYPLQLTRRGWDNPRKQQRGELQRVRYRLEEGKLWREYWPVLDVIDEEEGREQLMLLEGVSELRLQFLDDRSTRAEQSPTGGEWKEYWQPSTEQDRLPRAVELLFELEKFGRVKRVIEVAGA